MRVAFKAFEYCENRALRTAEFSFSGGENSGWTIERNGADILKLGAGYRLLRSGACGVCSTDLARSFLPFPLPQITGHEVIALDDAGRRFAVEINASHAARGAVRSCPFCLRGLANHCPRRLVLGIHDLPGGFGPWLLAPVHALHAIPDGLPDDTAVLIEPLAAALHAADMVSLREGDAVTVLGPRKLGMLIVAALAARRAQRNLDIRIQAAARRPELRRLALQMGADKVYDASDGSGLAKADIVFDTTGSPDGFAAALRLAGRELHVKSTHGRPAGGLRHLTGLVVDELNLGLLTPEREFGAPVQGRNRPLVGWLCGFDPPPWLRGKADILAAESAAALLETLEQDKPGGFPRVDAAVCERWEQIDETIRPFPSRETSPVRPRGAILIAPDNGSRGFDGALARGLRVTSSRCGGFAAALDLLAARPALQTIGERMITHRFDATQTPQAFQAAASPGCVKAVVQHPGGSRKR